jgi:transcription elongation factor GreA
VKTDAPKGVVAVGTKVRLRDMDAKQTIEYHIVGSAEANPAEHKLSNESPVGKAIMGKKKGEIVQVAAPRGSLKYKIMDVKAA